jgi:SAM-dependent methyltransferase
MDPPHIKAGDFVQARDPVGDYFAGKAPGYRSRSTRIPWAWVRTGELRAVRSLLGDIAGADVLELGAGAGFYTEHLILSGAHHVWAVDTSSAMLECLPAGPVTPVHGDAAVIRLERHFPVLVSTGMLEFVKDPEAVLGNAARHAEPGARFVILAPHRGFLGHLYRRFHRSHGFDIHLFDAAWFSAAAPRCGWRVAAAVRVAPFSLAVRLSRR